MNRLRGNIQTQIELLLPELPESERKVGEFILQNQQEITIMSVHQLAEEAGSSAAAVSRFCRSLGISGFPALKMRLSIETRLEQPFEITDVEANESSSVIADKVLKKTVQMLYDTIGQLNYGMIDQAVSALQKAEIIYFYGIGASQLVAEDAAQKWGRVGKKVVTLQDRHTLAAVMASQCENAVFWGFSYSGETKEVLQLIRIATELGMTTIGLSRSGNSKLSQVVDVDLSVARAPEAKLRSAATSSRFGQLYLLDVVFFTYASAEYKTMVKRIEKSHEIIAMLED